VEIVNAHSGNQDCCCYCALSAPTIHSWGSSIIPDTDGVLEVVIPFRVDKRNDNNKDRSLLWIVRSLPACIMDWLMSIVDGTVSGYFI